MSRRYNNLSLNSSRFLAKLNQTPLVLDGAMGTMIMKRNLDEKDFRGERYVSHTMALKGCNDVLSITRPDVIYDIHRAYLESGADIIETNSFNCNRYSLKEYGLENDVNDIARAAARVARRAADEYMSESGCEVWVAGSIGPTSKSLTLASQIGDDSVSWEGLTDTYETAATALIEGGVDLIIVETVFDVLNAKSAALAVERAMKRCGRDVPVAFSVTLTEAGRTLSGVTLADFVKAVAHARPFAVMLNCGFGVEGMTEPLYKLLDLPYFVGIYPNAGLPDEMGEYNESPAAMASKLRPLLETRQLNIVGGCCGTTPEHIAAIADVIRGGDAKSMCRPVPTRERVDAEPVPFVPVGERCNVAGSRKFLRLIKEHKIEEALDIAAAQVEAGAQIIDVNLDDAMLDSKSEMTAFLRALTSDARLCDVEIMVDSADFPTLEAAMQMLQRRSIVNSISLKEGEEKFVANARYIRSMGAQPVVMAFDEKGQAATLERRQEIFSRAFDILTSPAVGFNPDELIFDPNILAVCTGIAEHDALARDFVESVKWIKKAFPGVRVSGGLSNLSFSFRGNNEVREAMHAVFLARAREAGMDMAIVNPSAMIAVEDIEPSLKKAVEDALFVAPSPGATQRLIDVANEISSRKSEAKADVAKTATQGPVVSQNEGNDPVERLCGKIVRGDGEGLEQAIETCRAIDMSAMAIVDGPLMEGMNRVGELFGAGRLFLPQVVKSATVMKKAVDLLTPFIEADNNGRGDVVRKRIVLATVKGDVHDIGKNIVAVIMKCNNWDVIDLGVMVEPREILIKARECHADAIGVSGLITPSLSEMCRLASMMQESGMRIPLFVGGATTSAVHTAVKIAPLYEAGVVVHTTDAASLPGVAATVTGNRSVEEIQDIKQRQAAMRDDYERRDSIAKRLTIEEARTRRFVERESSPVPRSENAEFDISVHEARPYINWREFLHVWKIKPSLADVLAKGDMLRGGCVECEVQRLAATHNVEEKEIRESLKLLSDAAKALDELVNKKASLHAKVVIRPVVAENETITVGLSAEGSLDIVTPRQLTPQPDGKPQLALSDFLFGEGDYMGFFAVTTSGRIAWTIGKAKAEGDEYKALLLQSLADRLVEAATELTHHRVRKEIWGYSPDEEAHPSKFIRHDYSGIRPAVGYPSLPDQEVIFALDKVLDYASLGIELTDAGAMYPQASTTGLLFASPRSRYFTVL